MESVDIYDHHKNYTGRVPRQKAHDEGLWHWISSVYAFDQQGRLLVQYHKKYKMLDHSVGGHVGAGEDHSRAAHREAKEELGLEIPLVLITDSVVEDSSRLLSSNDSQNHFHAVYECRVPLDWEFAANDEVDDIRPMKLSEVIGKMNDNPRDFTPGFLTTMDAYLRSNNIKADFDLDSLYRRWAH